MKINDLFVPFEDELQLLPSPRVPDPPMIEWKSAFGDLFFRVKGAEPEILWCDLGYTVTPKCPLPANRRTTLAKRVSRAYAGRTFFRVVPFEDDEDWALVRPKRALVKSARQEVGASWWWNAGFGIENTQIEWLSQPQEWFSSWLAGFGDDVALRMARQCAEMSEEERAWNPETAQATRWKSLMRALFQLETPSSRLPCTWHLNSHEVENGLLGFICGGRSPISPRFPLQLSTAAQRLMIVLRGTIPLPYGRGLYGGGGQRSRLYLNFELDSVSAHERLEAAMLWRDFAREIDKKEEVEALLSKLRGDDQQLKLWST